MLNTCDDVGNLNLDFFPMAFFVSPEKVYPFLNEGMSLDRICYVVESLLTRDRLFDLGQILIFRLWLKE